jgi:ABC-type transport system involved in multi-copper enzyme maturation permease subunit
MSVQEKGKEWAGGCLVIIILAAVIGIYNWIDDSLFAQHRPWTLFLALVQLVLCGVGLVCFVQVLIRLWRSTEQGLGIVCALLAPFCGLGPIIAFVWGWIDANRDSQASFQEREKFKFVMQCWTAALVGQVVLWGCLWYRTPAQPVGGPGGGGVPAMRVPGPAR